MSNTDTCPHCGAEQDTFHSNLYYLCGSIKGMPEHRTLKCFKTQVAHQAAEIERLKGTLQYLIDVAEESNDNGTKTISEAKEHHSKASLAQWDMRKEAK